MIEVRGLTKRAMSLTTRPGSGVLDPPVLHLTHEPSVLDPTQTPTAPPAWAAAFVSTSFAAMSRPMAGSAGTPALSASVSMNRRGRGEIVGTTHRTRRWPRPGRSKPRGGYGGRSRRSTDPRATFVRAHERGGERDQHLVQHGLVSLPLQHVLGRAVRPDRLPHQAKPGRTRGQLIF